MILSNGRAAMGSPLQQSILSVDVEDWFHILDVPSTPPLSTWDSLPSGVERNFLRLLDLFEEHQVKVTCFFIGWVASRFPQMVKRAFRQGHEIASHGYAHRLVYEMSRQEFYEDALRTRKLLEDLSGAPVLGYRAAGFSVLRDDTGWYFEELARSGYQYDSSVFPSSHGHGGIHHFRREPHRLVNRGASMMEFPITVADLFGRPMCFFGGGYLRIFPYFLIRRMSHRVLREGRPVVFYVHPREIDPAHPRLPMSMKRRFKSYVNLASTEVKLRRILRAFPVTTFRDYLASNASLMEIEDAA
jgi:polysaccharide deacetylase family protein (PEP-CTERM system associated)